MLSLQLILINISINISTTRSTAPLDPSVEEFLDTAIDRLDKRIQHISDPHQQPAEEEQSHERDGDDDREGVPVVLSGVMLQVRDLHGEVAGH
jgi:hypothetical protein